MKKLTTYQFTEEEVKEVMKQHAIDTLGIDHDQIKAEFYFDSRKAQFFQDIDITFVIHNWRE